MGRRTFRKLFTESLETRRPLAADLAALDVNDDLQISPVDALMVINHINSRGTPGTAESEADLTCDTNADGVVSPQDVLGIINAINSGEVAVPAVEQLVALPNDDSSPTEDTPVDQSPTDDTPSSDVPADETQDNTDDLDTTDDSGDDSSSDNSDDTTGGDTTDDDTSGDDTTGDDSSGDDTTNDDNSSGDDSSGGDSSDDDAADDTDNNEDDCRHGDPGDAHSHHGESGQAIGQALRQHGNLFDRLDANDDGSLTSDEVPEALWDELVAADANEDGGITKAELKDYREAQRLAAIEEFFNTLDRDESGTLTSTDLPRVAWRLVSRADADANGEVTLAEFIAGTVRKH